MLTILILQPVLATDNIFMLIEYRYYLLFLSLQPQAHRGIM